MAVACGQLKGRVDILKVIGFLTSLLYFILWVLTGTFLSRVEDGWRSRKGIFHQISFSNNVMSAKYKLINIQNDCKKNTFTTDWQQLGNRRELKTLLQLLYLHFTLFSDVVFTNILNAVKNKTIGSTFCSKSYSPVVICELTLNHLHGQWSRRYHQILGLYKKDNHEVLRYVPWAAVDRNHWPKCFTLEIPCLCLAV